MKKRIILILLLSVFFSCCFSNTIWVKGEEISEDLQEQLDNLDLSGLDDYAEELKKISDDDNFYGFIKNILEGNFPVNYNNFFDYLLKTLFGKTYEFFPIFSLIAAIAVLCGIINSVKGSFLSEGVGDIICFLSLISVSGIIFSKLALEFESTEKVIENIANLSEIMSPIMITLMMASGGEISAGIYTPAVVFLSEGVINIAINIIMPTIFSVLIFSLISNLSKDVKTGKFCDFFYGTLKWIIGIITVVFGLFITASGIASGTHDGVSFKIAKYAISNTVPIIGGFLKDGFDLVVAGSILIKNSLGFGVLILLFSIIVPSLISLILLSLTMKLSSAVCETLGESRISSFLNSTSKGVSFIIATLLMVGFMFFITVLLMTITANSVI